MSIYNLSYDQKAVELLPPDKRTPIQLAWVKAMYGQLKYLRDAIFTYYKGGIVTYNSYAVNNWDSTFAGGYSIDMPVKYGEAVYVSLTNSNTTVPTSSDWVLVQNSFIGVDERVMFNANKLVFEYALNKRFNGVFRQPALVSDIYIVKNASLLSVFVVGATENESSIIYANNSTEVIINSYTFSVYYNFTIMVKTSVYNLIDPSGGANPVLTNKIIRNFVDRYNTIGLTYDIQTY